MTDEEAIFYPSRQEVVEIHQDIIESDEDAESGIINDGHIDYTLQCIQNGRYEEAPTTIHEKAILLMRLLAANHCFVDGNKRTALNTTWVFYLLNGYSFKYGEEIKAVLKLFAVMERMVDLEQAGEHFQEIAVPLNHTDEFDGVPKVVHVINWTDSLTRRWDSLSGDRSSLRLDDTPDIISETRDLIETIDELRDSLDDEETNELEEALTEVQTNLQDLVDGIEIQE